MITDHLAERVECQPDVADAVFARVDGAINMVLPGSDTHKRYRKIESVGLALAVGREIGPGESYSPFDPATMGRLSFFANNYDSHPEAWGPVETDADVLGGPIPEGMGRFTAFALAKLNTLSSTFEKSSVRTDMVSIEPGKVGLAGAQRTGRAMLSVSGLWEIHDHLVGRLYADELGREHDPEAEQRTADELAGEFERAVGIIKAFHGPIEAADLSRKALKRILAGPMGKIQGF